MHFQFHIFALFIFRWLSVFAQQTCYWPNGSGLTAPQGYWVSCYSNQASTSCLNGDVCLSNGLCYGPGIGMVRPTYPRGYIEQIIDFTIKTYRGGCTLKDWDNITACPNQWCNDGRDSLHC